MTNFNTHRPYLKLLWKCYYSLEEIKKFAFPWFHQVSLQKKNWVFTSTCLENDINIEALMLSPSNFLFILLNGIFNTACVNTVKTAGQIIQYHVCQHFHLNTSEFTHNIYDLYTHKTYVPFLCIIYFILDQNTMVKNQIKQEIGELLLTELIEYTPTFNIY